MTCLTLWLESWNMNQEIRKNLEATEIWFLIRTMRIPCAVEMTTKDCLEMTNESRLLYATMKKRQTSLLIHIIIRMALENIVTTGNINGRRSRCRLREIIPYGF